MPKMSVDNEREFEALSAYLDFFVATVWNVPKDAPRDLPQAMEDIQREYGKSKLLTGLRQAVNDTIENARDFTPTAVAMIDAACRSQGVLSLSEIRRRYWGRYKKIVERHAIRNETDYYLAVGVLNDMASDVSTEDRLLLQNLADAYEEKIADQGRKALAPDQAGATSSKRR